MDLERRMDVAFSLLVRMDLVDAELLRNILGMDSEDFFREQNNVVE